MAEFPEFTDDEREAFLHLSAAQQAQQKRYLESIQARERRERQTPPVARYAGQDPQSGEAVVSFDGGGSQPMQIFSTVAPVAGQIGRHLGVGFDVGQVYYEDQVIFDEPEKRDCVVGTWFLEDDGTSTGGGGGGGPVN